MNLEMLIPMDDVSRVLKSFGIRLQGVLHVGAHQCEELGDYHRQSLTDIIWVEANPHLVQNLKNRGIQGVIHAAVSDHEEIVTFNIANNGQSSSILDMKTHQHQYPDIRYVDSLMIKTQTLKQVFVTQSLDPTKYNFWNLDIQGVELAAIKGGVDLLKYVDAIYTEVNVKELYSGCSRLHEMDSFLAPYGFTRLNTTIVPEGWGDALYVRLPSYV